MKLDFSKEKNLPEKALEMFFQVNEVFHQIGSPDKRFVRKEINSIRNQIGEDRYQEILAEWEANKNKK